MGIVPGAGLAYRTRAWPPCERRNPLRFHGRQPDRDLSGVLALLFTRASEARYARLALSRDQPDPPLFFRGSRHRQPRVVRGDAGGGLRASLDRPFCRREEP